MPYDDILDDLQYGGLTEPYKYCHDDTIDTYKYALNNFYGIDTDDTSETNRLARVFGLDDIKNWYPSKTLVCARGNGKSLRQAKMWTEYLKPKIEKVIFNDPATIVLWSDGTKTVVKCAEEYITDEIGATQKVRKFDTEKGLAMAIAKRFLGTNMTGSNYYDEFKKWLPKEETIPYVETEAGKITLYADGLPLLGAKIDTEIDKIVNETAHRIYDLCKIAEENLERKNGKHMKGE